MLDLTPNVMQTRSFEAKTALRNNYNEAHSDLIINENAPSGGLHRTDNYPRATVNQTHSSNRHLSNSLMAYLLHQCVKVMNDVPVHQGQGNCTSALKACVLQGMNVAALRALRH